MVTRSGMIFEVETVRETVGDDDDTSGFELDPGDILV